MNPLTLIVIVAALLIAGFLLAQRVAVMVALGLPALAAMLILGAPGTSDWTGLGFGGDGSGSDVSYR